MGTPRIPPWLLMSVTAMLSAVCIAKPARIAPGEERGKIAPMVTTGVSYKCEAAQGGAGVARSANWVTMRVTSTGTSTRMVFGVTGGGVEQPIRYMQVKQ